MELYLNEIKYQIREFDINKNPEDFLRENKEYFFDKRLEIEDFLPDPEIYKKFYERKSNAHPKILEDAAVCALSLLISNYDLTKKLPKLGKEIIINPFGSDPTKGKGIWNWRFHRIFGKGLYTTDIDRILWIVANDGSRILNNCQIYNPQNKNFNILKKLSEKNRQLRPIEFQKNRLSQSEIIFFVNLEFDLDLENIFSNVKKFRQKYASEIRPYTNFSLIIWINKFIKIYRTEL
ncbi:MAG: hypothetical protein GPI99_20195 [Microcystis aeruginosa W13-15]|nr:hypothetical protein [Microcystis aeruginosa W13-15]